MNVSARVAYNPYTMNRAVISRAQQVQFSSQTATAHPVLTLLVVDDDAINHINPIKLRLDDLIESKKINFRSATSTEGARTILEELKKSGNIKNLLILMDHEMPGGLGGPFIKELITKGTIESSQVIMTSSVIGITDELGLTEVKACPKGPALQAFLKQLEKCLEEH